MFDRLGVTWTYGGISIRKDCVLVVNGGTSELTSWSAPSLSLLGEPSMPFSPTYFFPSFGKSEVPSLWTGMIGELDRFERSRRSIIRATPAMPAFISRWTPLLSSFTETLWASNFSLRPRVPFEIDSLYLLQYFRYIISTSGWLLEHTPIKVLTCLPGWSSRKFGFEGFWEGKHLRSVWLACTLGCSV